MSASIKLCQANLSLLPKSITVPTYDRSKIKVSMVHIGVGGFHRSHQAYYADRLMAEHGVNDCGICGIGLMPHDQKMYEIMKQQDCLYTLITKELDGTVNARVIGSIIEYLFAPEDPLKVIEKLSSPEVKIISLTITKDAYNHKVSTDEFDSENPAIIEDLKNRDTPKTVFGYLAKGLKSRMDRGNGGCSILSCDNIQRNGDLTKSMLCSFIKLLDDKELLDWVNKNVSFPNSMVDRITPATVETERHNFQTQFKVQDEWPVVCESFIQWVIEDNFSTGRPCWELLGAKFVPDVVPYEHMKLRLLNAGHTVLGILGALHGYISIDQAANDEDFRLFLRSYMDYEATPSLAQLDMIDLNQYKDTLIARFQNKYIKDQVARICQQSSSKFPRFILPVIRDQLKRMDRVAERAVFVCAAWCKYNEGCDDSGRELVVVDQIRDELVDAAERSKTDPVAFLKLEKFGDLAEDSRVRETFCKFLKEIREKKIKVCVREINESKDVIM